MVPVAPELSVERMEAEREPDERTLTLVVVWTVDPMEKPGGGVGEGEGVGV
jgi:hypothetical protein